nr:MAG TPA: hypothetical protein [Crassvirales sp.]
MYVVVTSILYMTIFEFNPHRCNRLILWFSIHTKTTYHYSVFHLLGLQ